MRDSQPDQPNEPMSDLQNTVNAILGARESSAAPRSILVAITGIDGCGKGYVTAIVARALRARGVRTAALKADEWLNLPSKRFDASNPAEHFYLHAIRFDDMFAQLILPLRDRRSLRVEVDCAEETATEYSRRVYDFEDIDVIVVEGIYLLKRALKSHYDRSFWIDCTFETALERAVFRSQEELSPEDTVRAYRDIYFPAQEIHFARDRPREAATAIVCNDARLDAECAAEPWTG